MSHFNVAGLKEQLLELHETMNEPDFWNDLKRSTEVSRKVRITENKVEHYEKLQKKGENIYIDSLTYDEFMMLGDLELSRRFSELEEESEKAKLNSTQDNELEYSEEPEQERVDEIPDEKKDTDWEDSITNRMMHWNYSEEQKAELRKAMDARIPKSVILSFFYPKTSPGDMAKIREQYLSEH